MAEERGGMIVGNRVETRLDSLESRMSTNAGPLGRFSIGL